MKFFSIPLLVLQLILAGTSLGAVFPNGCEARNHIVTCYNLTSFSLPVSEEVERIEIINARLRILPSYAFKNINSDLKSIVLESCHITSVASSAFTEATFHSLDEIMFHNVEIGAIEPNAFSDVDSDRVVFKKSTVSSIRPQAFYDASITNTLAIIESTIGDIEMNAFSEMFNVNLFTIERSHVNQVKTGAFEEFRGSDIFLISFNIFDRFGLSALSYIIEEPDFTEVNISSNYFQTFTGYLQGAGNKPTREQGDSYREIAFINNTLPCSNNVSSLLESILGKDIFTTNNCSHESASDSTQIQSNKTQTRIVVTEQGDNFESNSVDNVSMVARSSGEHTTGGAAVLSRAPYHTEMLYLGIYLLSVVLELIACVECHN